MTITTPVAAMLIALASLASIVALTIFGERVPDEIGYTLIASLGALFGGTVSGINLGK